MTSNEIANKMAPMTGDLYEYLLSVSTRESDLLKRLRDETAPLPSAGCQIPPEQGQFMSLLIQIMGVRRALEIGVFTGYSSTVVACAMPADGKLIACDVSEEWTSIARRYWREAGIENKIDLHLAPAAETLQMLVHDGQASTFDFAFIDADKHNYDAYYELCLKLLRPGGVVALDNTLWRGVLADPDAHGQDTDALRALNAKIHADSRVSMTLLAIGDGLTVAMKR